MDSLTQIILGAAVGEAILGKKIGNKALFFGAIAGTIPDLDVFIGFFKETISHRGFSHSFLFAFLMSPILAFLMKKYFTNNGEEINNRKIVGFRIFSITKKIKHNFYNIQEASFKDWTLLFFWGFVTHILLDVQTIYGTELFWPSNYRAAIGNVFVVDPLYTIPFLICVIAVMFYKRGSITRRNINNFGLILSTSYLLLTGLFKTVTYNKFTNSLEKQNITYQRIETGPTPFNSILWYATVETETEFLVAYYSLLDKTDAIEFKRFEKNAILRNKLEKFQKFQDLNHFSKDWYILSEGDNGIKYSNLRFGLNGMDEETPEFVFQYVLKIKKESLEFIPHNPRRKKDFSITKLFSTIFERMKGI